jgi:hypothetical protein
MPNRRTQVFVLTDHFRIKGEIDLIPGARITDFINEAKKFMVVSNATVADHNGKELLKGQFLNVRVNTIEVILPAESVI